MIPPPAEHVPAGGASLISKGIPIMSDSHVTLVAVHTIVRKATKDSQEERTAPGKQVTVPAAEAARLLRLGAAKPVEEVEAEEGTEAKRPATRAELEERAAELGIDLKDIKGSGKGGALKNADIAAAIQEAEDEDEDEDAAGAPPANPSVVA
jgi:pyruvate/2-oxoglutarate dehydrogenase complex dihydrolipoamide acyltransferase (E2) component